MSEDKVYLVFYYKNTLSEDEDYEHIEIFRNKETATELYERELINPETDHAVIKECFVQ